MMFFSSLNSSRHPAFGLIFLNTLPMNPSFAASFVATLPSSRKRVPAIPAADTFGTANSVSANTSAWYEK